MKSLLVLSFLLQYVHTISIGHISNVSLTLIDSSSSVTMTGTIQKCLCTMVVSSNISAFNYFSNNTCQFFSNSSLTNAYFSLTFNPNGLFYFLHLPSKEESSTQYSTAAPMLTTAVAYETGKRNILVYLKVIRMFC